MSSIVLGKTDHGTLKLEIELLLRTRLLIQGGSGSGKSWLLRRLAEQLFGKLPVIIIDPEGEFATLREKFGYVLVGKGGETPADPRSAALLAEKLLELHASAVCDLYEMKPADRHKWVAQFLQALVNAPKKLWQQLVVIVDEAHVFAPEKGFGESEALEPMIMLMSLGRKRGFCPILATQRLGKLNKSAAAELQNVLIGNTFIDVDRTRAAEALGVAKNKTDQQAFFNQVKVLKEGQFWALGRALTTDRTLVQIGPVETTHPKAGFSKHAGEPPPAPDKVRALLPKLADLPAEAEAKQKTVADLKRDAVAAEQRAKQAERALGQVQAQLAAHASQPKPTGTKRDEERAGKIAELKQLLAQRTRALEEAMKILVKIKAVDFSARGGEALEQAVLEALKPVVSAIEKRVTALTAKVEGVKTQAAAAETAIAHLLTEKVDLTVTVQKQAPYVVTPATRSAPEPRPRPTAKAETTGDGTVSKMARAMLIALAQHPDGLTKKQILIHSSYSSNGNTSAVFAEFVREGWADVPAAGSLRITDAGRAVLGAFDPLPLGDELREFLLTGDRLSEMERRILGAVCAAYPNDIAKGEILEAAKYSSNGNTSATFAKLVALGYATRGNVAGRLKAADELFG